MFRVFPQNWDLDTNYAQSESIHNYNTRGKAELIVPRPKSKLSKSALSYKIPFTVNKSLVRIKEKVNTHSYDGFSKYIKRTCIEA